MNVGENIKKIRQEKGLTIKDIAEKTDITNSLVSQIENNKVNPSLKTLIAIAEALRVKIGTFFDDPKDDNEPIVRANERKVLRTRNGVQYYMLTPQFKNHLLEFFYVIYEKDASTDVYFSHEGEECGYVIKGKFKLEYNSKEYHINEGDSLILDSTKPHRISNVSEGESIAIWVDAPASW